MRKTIILMAIVGSLLGAILVGTMSAANSAPVNYCHSSTLTAAGGSKGGCCPSGNQGIKDHGTNGSCCLTEKHGDQRGEKKPHQVSGCCVSTSKGHHDKDHDGDDHGKSHSDPDDAGCGSD
jgi:hypothetical protein